MNELILVVLILTFLLFNLFCGSQLVYHPPQDTKTMANYMDGFYTCMPVNGIIYLDKRCNYLNEKDTSPEFMKNGQWWNILINGYNGEK